MLTHRPVRAEDYQEICALPSSSEELFFMYPRAVYPLTPGQLDEAVKARSDSTVFERDGRLIGFANFYHWTDGLCCLGNVAVAAEARGQGVAQQLVRTMLRLAAQRHGAREIEVACFNENTAGLLLYTGLGFRPHRVEERVGPGGRRLALLLFRRSVAEEDSPTGEVTGGVPHGSGS